MPGISQRRLKVQDRLLDLFFETTNLPAGLFEIRDGQPKSVVTERCREGFRPFCKIVQSISAGCERCETDTCNRASNALNNQTDEFPSEGLVCCHAGLWNERVPVQVNREIRSVLFYGEMRVKDPEKEKRGLSRLEQTIQELGLDDQQAKDLRDAYRNVPRLTSAEIDRHKEALRAYLEWFHALVDEHDHLEMAADRVTHEIQTRMTALIAKAENLTDKIERLAPQDAVERALGVLHAIEALNTVVQTLTDALGEYHFKTVEIFPLLLKSASIYEEEAGRRGIEIKLECPLKLDAEVSEAHFQHALNNLVHNAVKYSFETVPSGRKRFVLISARVASGIGATESGGSRNATSVDNANHLVVSIENYGVGITEDEIRTGELFQLDARGKLTHGEFRPGSGKGLYFVKRVVDGHHGRIEVRSDLVANEVAPQGKPHRNRFTVYLPLRQRR